MSSESKRSVQEMNDESYSQMISRPTSFRRSELEQILQIVSPSLPDDGQLLQVVLQNTPIPKPDPHTGGAGSDWFEVSMPDDAIRGIADALLDAEAAAVLPGDAPSAEASRIAELLDRWSTQLRQNE